MIQIENEEYLCFWSLLNIYAFIKIRFVWQRKRKNNYLKKINHFVRYRANKNKIVKICWISKSK